MEPEREIEKLLRAYAQKRRAAAGDPLKLHPATRRRLQDEVSRRAPKPEAEETSLSLWQLFRQQWAYLCGFALLVFLGATVFFPALSASKKRAQSISAMNNLKQIGLAAQMAAGENNGKLPAFLYELTNGLVEKKILTDPVSGKPFVYMAGGENLDDLQSNEVLAYSPVDKDGRAVLLADGRVEYANRVRFAELTNQKSTVLAQADRVTRARLAKTTVNAPMAAAPPPPATLAPVATPLAGATVAGELKEQEPGAGTLQSFVQTGAAAHQQNLYRNVSVAARTAPVLQSFQVLQNGDAISVVDRDGSVYLGSVQLAVAGHSEGVPVEAPPGATASKQDQIKAIQSVASEPQATQNYFFRVTGLNRTLQQNVVFSGNVEAVPGVITNAQLTPSGSAGGGGGGGLGDAAQYNLEAVTNRQPWQLSNTRIVGTAVIDRTNRIEVNAVPATQ